MSIPDRPGALQRGLSLIELILFMLIVSIALVAILLLMNTTTARSSDPLVRKQVLAIAEALLEEVELMPFSYCDPDDANVTTATGVAGCATTPEALGPESGETRYSTTTPFDNVNDYDGFTMAGVSDINGTVIPSLGSYGATVTVTPDALAGTALTVASSASLRITVTVTGPGNESVTLEGYRTRYGPNSP
jgi:MSHA pilin protein MshD